MIAAKGYPENYQKGTEIKGLELVKKISGAKVLHAGTIKKDGKILANGGRVLNIIAEGKTFAEARSKAYEAVDLIDWSDGFARRDIAKKVTL